MRALPRSGMHGPWCGLRRRRLHDLAPERGRAGPLELRVDTAGQRGRFVDARDTEFPELQEIDHGLGKARVRMPLGVHALLHAAAEHEERNARASDHLIALRME